MLTTVKLGQVHLLQTFFPVKHGARAISICKFPEYSRTGYGIGRAARVQGTISEEVEVQLMENNLHPKDHPGIFRLPKVSLPEGIQRAAKHILLNENITKIANNATILKNLIWSRLLPMEQETFQEYSKKFIQKARKKDEALLPFLSQEETAKLENRYKSEVVRRLRQSGNHWGPIRYTREKALEYLLGRSAGEYAILARIFNEISKRDSSFQPKTLCDFGSGVGTVTWAARTYWAASLIEHMCADVSWEMNELAELILRGGSKNNDHAIPALFFRQHLPESSRIGYDLVVSSFSLLELESMKDRLQIIDKLWRKTEQYLVIVEPGTKAGFRIVMEARNYILGLGSKTKSPRNCHVFSPCPNSSDCPRFTFDTIPCNFEVKYRPLYPFHEDTCSTERFCYVVIRRGSNLNDEKWPRLIQEPLTRTRQVICRLCTKDAKISEFILTKRNHSLSNRVMARRSSWGDLLPVTNMVENKYNKDKNDT